MSQEATSQERNKAAVRAAFDRWSAGTGSPFELLADDSTWTITGSSPLSKTYPRKQFLDELIAGFNARVKQPLSARVRGIWADGDMVIALFDAEALAHDDQPYRNTYTWYFEMKDGKVASAIAFFDTRQLDALWTRVSPRR
ncbi:MAG TPA: nuclear transport factor 2 family protein [Myxococcota bacterium]|nr:nuclear transport factor 2 family protein [Myxococcota bacterium]